MVLPKKTRPSWSAASPIRRLRSSRRVCRSSVARRREPSPVQHHQLLRDLVDLGASRREAQWQVKRLARPLPGPLPHEHAPEPRVQLREMTIAEELLRSHGPIDALYEVWNGVPWMSPVWCRKPRITFLHHVHGPMWDQILPGPFAAFGRVLEARIAPPFYRSGLTVTPSEATERYSRGLMASACS